MLPNKTRRRRPRGDGSLQQLSKDKFRVQITIGYDQHGNQKRKSFTTNSQKAAIDMLNKLKAEHLSGTLRPLSSLTFADYAYRWLTIKKTIAKPNSFASYSHTCQKHLLPQLGSVKLQKLSTELINNYMVNKMSEGLSSNTISHHRTIIHSILDLAIREEVIGKNAVDASTPITKVTTERKTLTHDEMKILLAIARDIQHQRGRHFKNIYHVILLALATGARRGEILALRWENIDLENNTIAIKENLIDAKGGLRIATPKTKSSRRIIAVAPKVLQILKEDLWHQDNGLLFRSRTGKPLSFATIGKAFRNALRSAGIAGIRFHDLRHTHVTSLIADGVNIKMVSQRIGHNDVRTTLAIYAHTLPEQDREAAEIIGAHLL